MADPNEISRMIRALDEGDGSIAEQLLSTIYAELHTIAGAMTAKEPTGYTIQASDLVHEAYLRLFSPDAQHWNGRAHFFGAAAEAMRRILIEQARRKATAKRGGGAKREQLIDVELAVREDHTDLIALDAASTGWSERIPRRRRS